MSDDLGIERLEDLAATPKLNYAAPTVQAMARELIRRRRADPPERVFTDDEIRKRLAVGDATLEAEMRRAAIERGDGA